MKEGSTYDYSHLGHDLLDSRIEVSSDDYQLAEDPNNPIDSECILQASRIIRIDEDTGIVSLTTYESEFIDKKDELNEAIKIKSKEMLEIIEDITVDEEKGLLGMLNEAGHSTILYMKLSQGEQSGKPMFHVHFPKLFMDLDPTIPPYARVDFGVAVASQFLKRVVL